MAATIESVNAPSSTGGYLNLYSNGGAPGTSTTGTDTAGVNGTVWIGAINIPRETNITGISFLVGATGVTDKVIVMLFNSAGALVANSAVAGTQIGTAATMQRVPFTAQYGAAPGLYFVGVQTNGNTSTIRTQVFGDHPTASISQTFGTPVAITPPSTFTTNYAPYCMLY